MRITSITFRNFKALSEFSVSLQAMNVLVGPNNSGKSTVLSAIRALDTAMRRARSRRAERVLGGRREGHVIVPSTLPLSVENVHTDLANAETYVEFRITGGGRLRLTFLPSGPCIFTAQSANGQDIRTPSEFKKQVPLTITVIPVLGPVEHNEPLVEERTVKSVLATHRASRHFRNFWRLNPDQFETFRTLVAQTWHGMDIRAPEHSGDYMNPTLDMLVFENRMPRELYWSGFGFQVWCQLLTHIVHARNSNLLVVDEPEIYLHPDIQRQLLCILRDLPGDVVLATHSTEIMGEADPSEILLVDKTKKSARRLRDMEEVQEAFDTVGSVQNITLAQLARNRRVLFMEGEGDCRILRRFAKLLGFDELAAGIGLTFVESGGFSSHERVKGLSWGLEKTVGSRLGLGAIYDRDYWPDEQIDEIEQDLQEKLQLGHVWRRKEIENYLLVPDVLEKAIDRASRERAGRKGEAVHRFNLDEAIESIANELRFEAEGQYLARRIDFLKSDARDGATVSTETIRWFESQWADRSERLNLVPGKKALRMLRDRLQTATGVTLTEAKILDSFRREDIPEELVRVVSRVDKFRS